MGRVESRKAYTTRWQNLWRENIRFAKQVWNETPSKQLLKMLTRDFQLSVKNGDVQVINSQWYVTHAGLMRLARRRRCSGIHVEVVDALCNAASGRFVLKAMVYPTKVSSGFVGYGDADPSNVSSVVHGAEMRVAETRAVNRALRKAYGIGLCSVEELGWLPTAPSPSHNHAPPNKTCASNGSNNGHPRLRDKL